ncbi:H-NS histone family protein [Ramlibacter tataouinensis]|uniref:H-NS histone family protein n=1 Tax=Ramlibacter tataouinensis TaxID=94132 RepID=UPI0009EE4283|nr:H-NS histone family protein [Ramlibacter tataouinensis]
MATYLELQKQIVELQREADALKAKERKGVIARMKEAIAAYGITAAELGLISARARKAATPSRKSRAGRTSVKRNGNSVAYADSNGNTWGGRGKRPNWLREALANGAKLEDFTASKK